MSSANILNYEVRPSKYIVRRMLVATLSRIMGYYNADYRYIGFGGISFTDFKLIHRELHISDMISIEDDTTNNYERLKFNKPYSCINIYTGRSTTILQNLDYEKPCFVWLDYDGNLTVEVFEDIEILVKKLPIGSAFFVTCNRTMKNKETKTAYSKKELIDMFGSNIVPFDLDENCCSDLKAAETIARMINDYSESIILERNRITNPTALYKSLFAIKYGSSADREAPMITCGGVIIDRNDPNSLNMEGLPFVCDSVYVVNVPNLTHKEISYLNQILNNEEEEFSITKQGIIPTNAIQQYKNIYQYMPNFLDVRV